jgi:hypothetical protein
MPWNLMALVQIDWEMGTGGVSKPGSFRLTSGHEANAIDFRFDDSSLDYRISLRDGA